jgi:predicted lipoprotein with Yx(FWY)xxD motif
MALRRSTPQTNVTEERAMSRDRRTTLLATCIAAVAVAGCGGGDNGNGGSAAGTPPKTADGRTATIGAENSGLGQILDDSQGRTVYLFQKDTGTTSTCPGACASNWPPVRASGKPSVGSGATASEVGTTKRSDGGRQVTYNGHPLYTYTGDQKPGDTNGQGLTAFGGAWAASSPAGNPVSGGASNSGGSGY